MLPRRRSAQEQQRAATRAQLQDYRRRLKAEVAGAQQRAVAAAERQLATARAWPRPQLGLGHAAASQAYAAYLEKHEAAAQRQRQAEATAAERHAAAVAARQQELERIAREVGAAVNPRRCSS